MSGHIRKRYEPAETQHSTADNWRSDSAFRSRDRLHNALLDRIRAARSAPNANELEFEKPVKTVLRSELYVCHSGRATAGIRVDQLDASFEDRQIVAWDNIRRKVGDGTMPPEGMPQPTAAERKQMVDWITRNIEAARVRVAPEEWPDSPAHRRAISKHSSGIAQAGRRSHQRRSARRCLKGRFRQQSGNASPLHPATGILSGNCR